MGTASTTGIATANQPDRARRRALLIAASVVLVVGVGVLCIPGSRLGGIAPLVIIERLIAAAPAPVAYLIAGIGLGRLFRPLFRGASDMLALQVGVGLGALLTLSHLLGQLGLLGGATGPVTALGVIIIGCGLAIHQAVVKLRGHGWEPRASPAALVSVLGIAILIVAACTPPGIHWATEFGGYDVLEYHLQLPQEWLLAGRLRPVDHNVYSFLPGYVEAAYMHVGAMTLAPTEGPGPLGLLAGEGDRLVACQLLHAGFSIIAAWLTSRLAKRLAGAAAGPIAFALMALTPWCIVTGSMAYNEMALCGMLAAALLAATETGTNPWKRALVCGLLVGAASSIKPTGLLFVGVPVGLMLIVLARVRDLPLMLAAGCAAGLAVLAPWLLRNSIACGNPVFPFAASIFPNETGGTGAWTAEQVSRYVSAHRFDGGLIDRLRLLVMPDGAATPGNPSTHRGMMHPQWGLLFPFTLLSLGALMVKRGRDLLPLPILLLALGLLAQVGLWLFTTHLQSRFLLPLAVPASVLIAAAVAGLGERLVPSLRLVIAAVPLVAQAGFSLVTFLNERGGNPNVGLLNGASARTGQAFDGLPENELTELLLRATPELFINLAIAPEARVLLLGDATPLYFTRPVIYHTTYDRSPLSGHEPDQWNQVLRLLKIDIVLVNLSEVRRLEESGWNPPGITFERVARWMQQHARPIVDPSRWESTGQYLVTPLPEGVR